MSRTVVHLLRHGEVHNPGRILYGRIPGFYLSERGQAMAQRIADDFTERGADVAHVVASPLLRAQQTATPLARAYEIGRASCREGVERPGPGGGVSKTEDDAG